MYEIEGKKANGNFWSNLEITFFGIEKLLINNHKLQKNLCMKINFFLKKTFLANFSYCPKHLIIFQTTFFLQK